MTINGCETLESVGNQTYVTNIQQKTKPKTLMVYWPTFTTLTTHSCMQLTNSTRFIEISRDMFATRFFPTPSRTNKSGGMSDLHTPRCAHATARIPGRLSRQKLPARDPGRTAVLVKNDTQHNTPQHNTMTAQHSTTQHNTQHNTQHTHTHPLGCQYKMVLKIHKHVEMISWFLFCFHVCF